MSGPFYFAWIESGESPSFGPEHHVEDEKIASFKFTHAEGRFATLDISVVNPRTGPLAPGRKQWAWFSKQQGGSDGEIVPIGLFRLTAMPTNMLANLVGFSLQAEPVDFQAQKKALADTLRVLPYYDELFVNETSRDDPDAVLEAYSAAWHVDPVTHVVSISDVLVGEDGTVNFGGDDAFYDSVDLTVARPPINAVTIKGAVPWTQSSGSATIDLGETTFATANSKGIVGSWPKAGDQLAGGYYVVAAKAESLKADQQPITYSINYTNEAKTHRDGDTMSYSMNFTGPPGTGPDSGVTLSEYSKTVIGDPATGTPASFDANRTAIILQTSSVTTSITLGISATNDLQDSIEFRMTSDIQPVIRDPESEGDETSETIEVNSNDASEGESPPIEDAGRGEYITTDRGMQSVVNMLLRGRARLRIGSRIASVRWRCRFDDAMPLSLRQSAFIADARIPGGQAVGKIVEYALEGDGATGAFVGAINIGCSVGRGTSITTSDGEPDYVEEDYVDPLYQTYTGIITAIDTGDAGYGLPALVGTVGSGVTFPLDKSQLLIRDDVMELLPGQQFAWADGIRQIPITEPADPSSADDLVGVTRDFSHYFADVAQASLKRLAEVQTWREIELVDLTNKGVVSSWTLDVTPLVLPRQIDFEAP